eukprot:TRINITY_DN540_c0_g1_i1.p1 TRINITY_DN540_c0_g1~~TRINITY_DN540_c0_g1_i1.p1  ORF type:complete len:101 (-),score=34.67 TRINITY_DN540_c0_g1_i1:89-391(-)
MMRSGLRVVRLASYSRPTARYYASGATTSHAQNLNSNSSQHQNQNEQSRGGSENQIDEANDWRYYSLGRQEGGGFVNKDNSTFSGNAYNDNTPRQVPKGH